MGDYQRLHSYLLNRVNKLVTYFKDQSSWLGRIVLSPIVVSFILVYALYHAFGILFFKSATSFVVFTPQNDNGVYKTSYLQHKKLQTRTRFFSLSSFFLIVIGVVGTHVISSVVYFSAFAANPTFSGSISNITINEDTTTNNTVDLDTYFTPLSGACTYTAVNEFDNGTMTFDSDGTVDFSSTASSGGYIKQNSAATRLLLHAEGDNLSTTLVDTGARGDYVFTASGDAKISTTQKKFGASSMYFDGSGDYFTSPALAEWDLGSTWTVEFWARLDNLSGGPKILSTRGGSGTGWEIGHNAGRFFFEGYGANNTGGQQLSAHTFTTNTWYHVAVVTNAGATKLYVDGVEEVSVANAYSWSSGGHVLRIGLPEAFTEPYAGYIDDLRITTTAVYTGAFTTPTTTLADVAFSSRIIDTGSATAWNTLAWKSMFPSGKPLPNSTGIETAYNSGNADMTGNNLLLHFDETGSPTSFADSSGANHNGACSGAPCPTPTTAGKFNGAMSFDGGDDKITFSDSFALHTSGAASVAVWVKIPDRAGNDGIVWSRDGDTDNNRFNIYIYNGKVSFDYRQPDGGLHELIPYNSDDPSLAISANVWQHIVITRSSDNLTYKFYVNGVLAKTVTDSAVILPNSSSWAIGGPTGAKYSGVLDEFATWSRELSSTQVLDYYKRGAAKVKYQVRSCDDAACSGENFAGPGTSVSSSNTTADFDTADEANYTQEDATSGTDFSAGLATLHSSDDGATKFLMHADGSNGSTTFTDSSSTAATLTATGATVSTAQNYFGTGSAYFSSDAHKIVSSSSNAYNFTGTYTQEFWLKTPASLIGNRRITMASNQHLQFLLIGSALHYAPQSGSLGVTTTLSPSTWYHIAVSRDENNILRWFVNGTLVYSVSLPGTVGGTGLSYGFGKVDAGLEGCTDCYIDEVRLTSTALYTTAPTAAFTADANTTTLLHADSNFSDASTSNHTFTASGAAVSVIQSKFGGSSILFDGSNDYISTPASSDYNFGTGDFTVETWVYPTTIAGDYRMLFNTSTTDKFQLAISNDNKISFVAENASTINFLSSAVVTTNAWQHIAVTRSGSTITLWHNGVNVGSTTYSGSLGTSSDTINIGYRPQTPAHPFAGYMDEIRVTKGIARYGSFIPSTSAFSLDSKTSLLLHGDGTSITDESGKTITTVNSAETSAEQSKFGGKAIKFNNNGHIASVSHADFALGGGDFTTEFWLYATGASDERDILMRIGNDSDAQLDITLGHATATNWSGGSNIGIHIQCCGWGKQFAGTKNVTDSTWHHVALVRQGTSLRLYVDGILDASDTFSYVYLQDKINIGGQSYGDRSFSGYLDEIRVTKGVARYGSNFTVPTSAFAAATYPTSQPYYVSTASASQFGLVGVTQISSLAITATQPTNTTIKTLVSFDGRSTWKYYSGGSWQTAAGGLNDLQTSGMTVSATQAAFTNWTRTNEASLDFAFDLATTDSAVTPSVDLITINYTALTNAATTFYSEATSTITGLPSINLADNVSDNRYFQYRAFLQTENSTYVPKVHKVSIGATAGTYTDQGNGSSAFGGGTQASTTWAKNNSDTVQFRCTNGDSATADSNILKVYYGNTQFTSSQTGNWNSATTWGGDECIGSCEAGPDYPSASHNVTIASGHTVTVPVSTTASFGTLGLTGNLLLTGSIGTGTAITINSGGTLTQDNATAQTLSGALTVNSGGSLTHSVHNASHSTLNYRVKFNASTITVNNGGSINVDSKGYLGGQSANATGIGASTGKGTGGSGGGGGGHGGAGGNASSGGTGGATNDVALAPVDLGSGGGAGNNNSAIGGVGGGAIELTASTSMIFDGLVSAIGGSGTAASNVSGGGGAGGSIYLTTPNLSGNGSMSVNGGNGASGATSGGGGGGGGLISITGLVVANNFTGTVTKIGGTAGTSAVAGSNGVQSTSNIAPTIALTATAQQTNDGDVDITYTLTDGDANNQTLNQYEYSTDNSAWQAMTAATGDVNHQGVSGLSASAGGNSHTFVWDVCTNLATVYDASVYVRLRSNDGTVNSNTATSSAFTIDCAAPTISSVTAQQAAGTDTVTFTYTLADDTITNLAVALDIDSASGTGGWTVPDTAVAGHIGSAQNAGNKTVTWAANTDAANVESATYRVRLQATDQFQNVGNYSPSSDFAIDTKGPTALAGFNLTSPLADRVTLNWTAATETNFDHYEIWYGTTSAAGDNRTGVEWDNTDDSSLATRTTTSTIITSLNPVTTYYFKIWAVDTFGHEMTLTNISGATTAAIPTTPSATSPTDNQTDLSANLTLAGSSYAATASSTHFSTDWQVSDDNTFSNDCSDTNIVWCTLDDQTNKTSITVNTTNGTFQNALLNQTQLKQNTLYYGRMRYTSNSNGDSSWSTPVAFRVVNSTPIVDTNTFPVTQSLNEDVSSLNSFDLDNYFSDGDDTCTYTLSDDPSPNVVVTIAPDHAVSFAPGANYTGTETVRFRCADSYGATSDSPSMTLTINPVNDAPTVSIGSPITLLAGDNQVTFQPTITDIDGDTLSYQWTIVADTSGIAGGGCALTNTTTAAAVLSVRERLASEYTCTVRLVVTDSSAVTANDSIIVTVKSNTATDTNEEDEETDTTIDLPAELPNLSLPAGTRVTTFDLDDYFTTATGTRLTYSVSGHSHIQVTIDENGVVEIVIPDDFIGTETIIFTALTLAGESLSSNPIVITVEPVLDSNDVICGTTVLRDIAIANGSSQGKGIVKIFSGANEKLREWKAFNEAGVIPLLTSIEKQIRIFTIKSKTGTTLHVYNGCGQVIKKKRLSPQLHWRRFALAEFDHSTTTKEIVVATQRQQNVYLKIYSYNNNSNTFRLLWRTYYPGVGSDYYVRVKGNSILLYSKQDQLITRWKINRL